MENFDKLRVLIVDDEQIIHDSLGSYLEDLGTTVSNGYDEESAFEKMKQEEFDLVLLDVLLPRTDGLDILKRFQAEYPEIRVVMITGHGTMEMAVSALRNGAIDFLSKPIKLRELDAVLERVRRHLELQQERNRLREAIGFIQKSEYRERGDWRLIGNSAETQYLRKQIEVAVVGKFDTILLTGETGTGKEVVTREIHKKNGCEKPFIPVSCPAIPENLIESELFGHTRGAFTGASESRPGSFEMADDGILFLDEISELSEAAQAKLLRVLETRCVRRVGGTAEQKVNVIVVAATNIPLHTLVEKRRFRKDLLYRLNAFSIELKPLRERKADIIPIAEHFLRLFIASRNLAIEGISERAQQILLAHPYPGNARELRNIVERAAVLKGQGWIEPSNLNFLPSLYPFSPVDDGESILGDENSNPSEKWQKNQFEKEKILLVLKESKWNRKEAAKTLRIPYSTLRYKLKKYDIS